MKTHRIFISFNDKTYKPFGDYTEKQANIQARKWRKHAVYVRIELIPNHDNAA